MIPRLLDPLMDPCELVATWRICPELAGKLLAMTQEVPYGLQIISGFRTREEQEALQADPDSHAAAVNLSTHCSCPATGADLWPTVALDTRDYVKATFAVGAHRVGLRVGGGSPVDPVNGIHVDWNHVDLGPRKGAPTP